MGVEWWYSKDGERLGPLAEPQLQKFIQNGDIGPVDLVWREGMDEWTPQSEVEELSNIRKSAPPELPIPSSRDQLIELEMAGAWRRFFARFVDLWFLAPPIAFCISYGFSLVSTEFALWIQTPGSDYAFGWFMLPIILLTEALIFAAFGTTLGKSVLGVKVITNEAGKLSAKDYLKRQLGVYWTGLGAGVPFVNLFTMARQRSRLTEGKLASYDEGSYNVKAAPMGFFRWTLAVVVIAVVLSIQVGVRAWNQHFDNETARASSWTNPVTSQVASIPPGWTIDNTENTDGQPIYMYSHPATGVVAIFAYEEMSNFYSLEDYLELWKVAVESELTLYPPEERVNLKAGSAIRVKGQVAGNAAEQLEVYLLQLDHGVWRIVLVGTGGRNPATTEALALRDILFSTISP
jgi:uncharacterized RDD family membrane protein YckC